MDNTTNYPDDPNTNKNRIPEKTELVTLRKLAQHDEQIIQDLDQKIEQGEKDCSAIQQRYDDLLRAIEGVQSELVASRRSVDIFKNQRVLIQDHLDQMKGLIHPIRRCPSEILQHIFEWAYEVDENPFKASTVLSHVCCRWREIALQMPYLWTNAIVSLRCEAVAAGAFWSRTVERAKTAPMKIVIQHMTGDENQWKIMQEAPLHTFTHIEHIEFQLESREALWRLQTGEYHVPTGSVDHLEISCSDGLPDIILSTTILEDFPSLTSLTLDDVPRIRFDSLLGISTVTQVTIIAVSDHVSFLELALTFPNIEELNLLEILFDAEPTEEVSLEKLRILRSRWCTNVPWRDLEVPSITYLSVSGDMDDDIVDFITSHKSILYLDTTYSKAHIGTIASGAPQLVELTINICEELCDRKQMKLSNLRNLTLYYYETDPFSLELFEQIVRSRLLPPKKTGRKAKEDTKARPSLTILADGEIQSDEHEWRASPLLSSASEVFRKIQRIDGIFYSYTFTWT